MDKNINLTIIDIERNLFNNLQSDFYKMFNILNKHNTNIDKNIIIKLIKLNSTINNLQLEINNIKIALFKQKKNQTNDIDDYEKKHIDHYETEYIINDDKDNKVIELFKPYMLYYRMLLDIS